MTETKKQNPSHAPKPSKTTWQWIKSIGVRVFFLIALWDFLIWVGNKAFGKFIGAKILPAQLMYFSNSFDTDKKIRGINSNPNAKVTLERLSIPTKDGATLDTVKIQSRSSQNHTGYIIRYSGNSDCYENSLDEMISYAEEFNCTVMVSNYRGVSASRSKYVTAEMAEKDPNIALETTEINQLGIDAIAPVKYLLDQGVPASQITLLGHSMGSVAAIMAAAYLHAEKKLLYIFSDRSCSSITDVLVARIRIYFSSNDQESALGICLGWLAKPFIKLILILTNWEFNAGDAFAALPSSHREYICIRSEKIRRKTTIDDSVIPHYASIHRSLQNERLSRKNELKKLILQAQTSVETGTQSEEALKVLKESLKRIKYINKVEYSGNLGSHGDTELEKLSNRYNRGSAREFFALFFYRLHTNHHSKFQNDPLPLNKIEFNSM